MPRLEELVRVAEEDMYERAVLMHNSRDTDAVRGMRPYEEREVTAPFPVHESQLTG